MGIKALLKFLVSPQPIKKTFLNWNLDGNLQFTVDLYTKDSYPTLLPISGQLAASQKEWHNINMKVLRATIIAIGLKISLTIESLEHALLLLL